MSTVKQFVTKGFFVKKNIIKFPPTLYKDCLNLDPEKYGTTEDGQVPGTPSFYNIKALEDEQDKLLPTMEKLTGLKLYKTYQYFRNYKKGDLLEVHTDRPACEISATINIGQKQPWKLSIKDYDGKDHHVILNPGDALIYKGCELPHWRDEKNPNDKYTQVFMHFVDKNGPCAWCEGDKER